jgi:undecaprenyl-diphosphatase
VTDGAGDIGNFQLIAGVLASAISGFAAISFLLRFLQRSSTLVFVIYRVVVGIGILLVLATGLR